MTETCAAAAHQGVMECKRCGLAWPEEEAAPGCRPITFEVLKTRMLAEVVAAEMSLTTVRALGGKGLPTDSGAHALRKLAELEAVLRLVERVAGDKALKAMLNGKAGA